ncbi:MAG: ankyrin repeat domain-containing protein [Verrucomicrobiales bacterium]|nr:ankyrin repeat domain-containing protein [Verrucomicrobiales bacterium]
MKPVSFLFRTALLAVFTLSLLAGAIVTDYYLRHEVTRQAKRFLAQNEIELNVGSAIEAARKGELVLLEKLEQAGVGLGLSDEGGRTPLLVAVQEKNLKTINFLINRGPVKETINQFTSTERLTPLAAALNDRNFELADQLIEAGASLDVDQEAGMPFLIEAVRSNDEEMLDFLLSYSADVEYRGAEPVGALAVAAASGNLELTERLIKEGASPDARGVSGKPLLIEAVKERNDSLFDLLIESGADISVTVGETAGREMSALSFAVATGNRRIQKLLLEKGASPDVYSLDAEPLLYDAIEGGNEEAATLLLEHGAVADVSTDAGLTPLKAAIQKESLDMVDLLLAHDADPSFAKDNTDPPLLAAIELGNIAVVNQLILAGAELDKAALLSASYERRDDPLMSLLLNAGADPESLVPGTDTRVFDLAVQDGATGAVRTLLDAGANIGDNLWGALLTGQDDLIRLILDAGADPRQPGPEGQDPLNYCLTNHRYKAARVLLDGGADPNARFDEEETWLSKAVREGNAPIAKALVEAGAEVEGVLARDGHSLLGWAVAHEMAGVVKSLLEAGADPDKDERNPARSEFRDMFDSKTFRYHLQVDRRIRPIMMAAAQRNHEIAQILMDGGANGRAYTPKYLMAAIIGSWYKDAKMQQIALLGKVPEVQPRKVVVDLSSQRVTLYENGVATYSTACSTGKSGYRTPTGEYVISDRNRHHNSSIYGSSMPYFSRFSYSAFGLHQGYVPGYPASHGCIRLPYEGARYLFSKLKVGDYAVIQQ